VKRQFNDALSDKPSSDNSLDSSDGKKKKKVQRTKILQRVTLDDKDKLNQKLADVDSDQAYSDNDD
jgi:hypothetical protein